MNSILKAAVLALALGFGSVFALAGQPLPQPIEQTLRELSRVTGEIFTLEKWAYGEGDAPSEPPIDFAVLNRYTDARKILDAYYPSYGVLPDRVNPLILHVYNTNVVKVENYPITREVRNFTYSGAVWPYFSRLAAATTGVSIMETFSTADAGHLAPIFTGQVNITFDQSSLREALTLGIDPGSTKGIIWISYTTMKNGVVHSSFSTTSDAKYFSKKARDDD